MNAPLSVDDPILPTQMWDTATFTAEQRLMAACIEDAVETVRRRRCSVELLASTWAWLRIDDRAWPFSFVNICDALALDASAIRRVLMPHYHLWLTTGLTAQAAKPKTRRRWRHVTGSRTRVVGHA